WTAANRSVLFRTLRGACRVFPFVDFVCSHLDRNRVLARTCCWPKGSQLHWVLHLQLVLLPGRAHRRVPCATEGCGRQVVLRVLGRTNDHSMPGEAGDE